MPEQTSESRLSHSKHKHNSEVQGDISEDYDGHSASITDLFFFKNEEPRWCGSVVEHQPVNQEATV